MGEEHTHFRTRHSRQFGYHGNNKSSKMVAHDTAAAVASDNHEQIVEGQGGCYRY